MRNRGLFALGVCLLVLIATRNAAGWEKTIVNIPGFTKNVLDTHMYWDGNYLWLPEAEFDYCPAYIHSNNLIRYDPLTEEVVNYPLSFLAEFPVLVYEVVPGGNPDTLYVSAPYSKTKAIYIFDKTSGVSERYTPPDIFKGDNGAKMAVTTIAGTDYVWTTGLDGYIGKFKTDDQTIQSFDFSEYGGFYGIAAVPTDTENVWTIFAASLTTGNLLMFPSDAADTNDPNVHVINIGNDLGLSHSVLTSLHYDGEHVWIAISSNDKAQHGFVRYTPSRTRGELGRYSVYWTDAVYVGGIPTMTDFDNHMWMTTEEWIHCDYVPGTYQNPQLLVIDKETLATETIPLPEFVALDRSAASLGHDNDFIYVGGYGLSAPGFILNLLKVTPQPLAANATLPEIHYVTTNQGPGGEYIPLEDLQTFSLPSQRLQWIASDPDALPEQGQNWEWTLGIAHSYVSYWTQGMTTYSPETELVLNDDMAGYFARWKWISPVLYLPGDGSYWVKLVAEDADGNRREVERQIKIDTADTDGDGISDVFDNCPENCNTQQLDADGDSIGDVCDPAPGCGGCGLPVCEQEC